MTDGVRGTGSGRKLLASRIGRRITLFSLAVTMLAAVALSLVTHGLIESRLMPELKKQSATLAEFAAYDIRRALGYGIPLDKLRGVDDHFDALRAPHPEIDFIALLGPDGKLLHFSGQNAPEAGRVSIAWDLPGAADRSHAGGMLTHAPDAGVVLVPVETETGLSAMIAVGTDPHFTERQMRELALDVLVILIVAVFLSFEISIAVLTTIVTGPLSELVAILRRVAAGDLGIRVNSGASGAIGTGIGHAISLLNNLQGRYVRLIAHAQSAGSGVLKSRLNEIGARFGLAPTGSVRQSPASPAQVRLALFVLVGADEMQKAFLPLYVGELGSQGLSWLSPEVMIGLPISIYMLALALCTPFAGQWTDRLGARRIFLFGLVPAFMGFVGSALAATVLELTIARALSAIGYALCTIAAQGFILAQTPKGERAAGASIFISVIMAASICGTAIGGILADLVGYRAVFVGAALLSVIAALLAWRMLPRAGPGGHTLKRGLRWSDMRMLMQNVPFMALLLLAAIPAKIVLTGFLFYAVPIALSELGTAENEIARAMILYSLIIILCGPWLSRLASTAMRSWALVALGTLLSGIAIILLLLERSMATIVSSVVLIGLAHAMSISPQIALVTEICRKEAQLIGETAVLGIFRMLERAGSVVGPVLVAGLIAAFGIAEGLAWTGFGIIIMGALLLPLAGTLAREREVTR